MNRNRFIRPSFILFLLILSFVLWPASFIMAADPITWIYYNKDDVQLPQATDTTKEAVKRTSGTKTQHALDIRHDFSGTWGTGYLENIGNPVPPAGKTWIDECKSDADPSCGTQTAKVDGIVQDVYDINSRYIATGYEASGAANPEKSPVALAFDGVNDYVSVDGIDLSNKNSFTVEFSSQRNALGRNECLFAQGTKDAGKGIEFGYWDNENKARVHLPGWIWARTNSDTDLGWHQWKIEYKKASFTWNGATGYGLRISIYRDNQLVSVTYGDIGVVEPLYITTPKVKQICSWDRVCDTILFVDYNCRDVQSCRTEEWDEYSCKDQVYTGTGTFYIGRGIDGDYFKGLMKDIEIKVDGQTVGNWKFNDGGASGTAKDSSRYNRSAALKNFSDNSCWTSDDIYCWASDPNLSAGFEFASIQSDQEIPGFKMTGHASIVYQWDKQVAVSVMTTPDAKSDKAFVEVMYDTGQDNATGSGKFWYNLGTALKLTTEPDDCIQLLGYRDNLSMDPNKIIPGDELVFDEPSVEYPDAKLLDGPVSITWEYSQYVYEETVTIGSPLTFSTVPLDVQNRANLTQKPFYKVDESNQTPEDQVFYWSAPEKRLFPVKPDQTFQVEWDMTGECPDDKLITRITTRMPDTAHYIHVAETPPVALDSSAEDLFAFKDLKYTSADATVSENEFSAEKPGDSVLVFTRADTLSDTKPQEISLTFDGASGYGDAGNISLGRSAFTIEFWAKRASKDRMHVAVGQGVKSLNQGLQIGFDPNNKFMFGFFGNDLVTENAYTDSNWHHWACVYEAVVEGDDLECFQCVNDPSTSACRWNNDTCYTKNFTGRSVDDAGNWKWDPYFYANRCINELPVRYKRTIYRDGVKVAAAIYRDGVKVAEDTTDDPYKGIGSLRIGSTGEGWDPAMGFDGNLDEIRIWDTPRDGFQDRFNRLNGDEDGLIAYWRFDNIGASFEDDSRILSIPDINPPETDLPEQPELSRTCLSFNGTGDSVLMENPFSDGSSFTIELWVNPELIDNDYHALAGWREGAAGSPSLYIAPGGGLYWDSYDADGNRFSGMLDAFFTANRWVHLAWVKDGTTYSFYRNGNPVNETGEDAPETLMLFNRYALGKIDNYFKGQLDDIRIWNIARTEAEIRANLNNELTGSEPGLAAYYQINNLFTADPSTVADMTANQNDGVMTNMNPGSAYVPSSMPGTLVFGNALIFDGVDDYVDSGTGVELANSSFTVEFWAKRAEIGRTDYIFIMGDTPSTNEMLHLGFRDSNVFTLAFYGQDLNTQAYTDRDWHHWACVYDSGSKQQIIYRDGVTVAQRTANSDFIGTNQLYLGLASFNRYFKGQLDEVRVWNIARSGADIQRDMTLALAGDEPGLKVYYDFNQIVGTLLADKTAEKQDGALVNMTPAWVDGVADITPAADPNNALNFDGINDYVETGLDDLSGTELTIEYWFKGSYMRSVVRHQAANGYIVSGWNGLHILSNDGGTDTNAGIAVGSAATDGNWHHIAMTWEMDTPGGFVSYLDGEIVTRRDSGNTPIPNIDAKVLLGSYAGISEFLNGAIDEVRIWNIARSQADIQSTMNSTLAGDEAGLKAYYDFNQTPATVLIDKSVGQMDGKLVNMAIADGITTIEPGNRLSGALSFDGVDDYVELPGFDTAGFASFTFECWFSAEYISDSSPGQVIIDGPVFIELDSWKGGGLRFNTDPALLVGSRGQYTDGGWHHLAAVNDASGMTMLYIDGKLEGSLSSGVVISDAAYMTFGCLGLPGTGRWLNGKLDEVRIWNVARSQAEIQDSLSKTLVGNEEGLLLYYNFDNRPFTDMAIAETDALNFGPTAVFFTETMYPFVNKTYMAMDTTSKMEIPHSGSLESGAELTVEAWVNPDEILESKVVAKADSDKGYALGISAEGNLKVEIRDDKDIPYTFSSGKIVPGQWSHIAMTWKTGGNLIGYINGFEVNKILASDIPIGDSGTSLIIGSNFKGRIDDVRVWNVERTQDQIKAGLMRQLTGDEDGLVAYYTFDNVVDTRLGDATANNNKGIISGATLIQEGMADNMIHHPLTLVNIEPSDAWSVNTTKLYEGTPDTAADNGLACVRVVKTIKADGADTVRDAVATAAAELTSTDHGNDVPHNGYVFREIGPYNADIYDRENKIGSIYPVNVFHPSDKPKEDKILVVWYRMQDNIAWSYKPVEYSVNWPTTSDRIVVASRIGSEGKDGGGEVQTFPDMDKNPQNYFDPARYRDIEIYNQPDPEKPGYNPNEEHALIAPSFRHSQASPQPSAAFALRNDLNVTTVDASGKPTGDYTSLPYVLVQYFDQLTEKHGMTPFGVEIEDAECNYTFNYGMKAGEPVVAPYPVNVVIGAATPPQIFGKNGDPEQKCYWEDHKGQSWAISGAGETLALSDDDDNNDGVADGVVEVSSSEYTLQLDSGTFTDGDSYLVKVSDGDGPVGDFRFTAGTASIGGINAPVRVEGASASGDSVTVTLKPGIAGLNKKNFKLYHYTSDAHILSYFWYPLDSMFWIDESTPGDGTGEVGKPYALLPSDKVAETAGFPSDMLGKDMAVAVRYDVTWPDDVPILKAGETLTFPGGEYRADNPDAPGLPGVLGWAAGQVVFDDLNPIVDEAKLDKNYLVRLGQVLEERSVDLKLDDLPDDFKPAAGKVNVIMNRYYFKGLHAGLKQRICYDPMTEKLIMKGFVNDRTVGDKDLTAAPPAVYVTQPNIMTKTEKKAIEDLVEGANENEAFKTAVGELYKMTGNPNGVPNSDGSQNYYYAVGLDAVKQFMLGFEGNAAILEKMKQYFAVWLGVNVDITDLAAEPERKYPSISFGPGLAVLPNGALLDPDTESFADFTEGYVTLAENNHPELDTLPVALHIIKVKKDKYRGAIKTVFSDNVFDEKISLRHTADFGGKADELVFQWRYREEDGTDQNIPNLAPAKWQAFPDFSGDNGLGMSEIVLAGAGPVLLADQLFFVRYRHDNSPEDDPASWSDWAGAANSRPPKEGEDPIDTYQAQLCEGWIKRVINGLNPFEARIRDFLNTDSPATYVSMIQQAGQRYEGAVAFNPAKDVIENVGLIELYQTVLERGKDLSIDLSQPVCTSGVTAALMLAASRISGFYTLLGNEAYNDALDPTIGFGTSSVEYGSLAPAVFSFTNQVPTLLDEELALLRGRSEEGARPVYNRLLWNFTKDRGEAAYGMNYLITDVTRDGFINDADGQRLYPQGHGDAWGHYLTAVKSYYDLLRNPEFKWESRSEKFQIQGVVMDVDYFDERKFAEAAAAKAKVGSEIVDLTYRSRYVDDPDGQWQGYKDTDKARAWGVSEWNRRAGHGAYFDWATVNAVLPSAGAFRLNRSDLDRLESEVPLEVYNKLNTFEGQGYANESDFRSALTDAGADPTPYPNIVKYAEKSGLKRVDRTTVTETLEIASQSRHIQKQADDVNTGLNPLGLANDTVPFDIDPVRILPNSVKPATHFEQIAERAFSALENARVIFDQANDIKNRIRQTAVSTEEFTQQVIAQDRDYRNRMIELFGTPYEGTIGSGKVYPAGYQGPDYYLYNYIDVNEVNDATVPASLQEFTIDENNTRGGFLAYFTPLNKERFSGFFQTDVEDYYTESGYYTGVDASNVLEVEFPQSAGKYSFVAPDEWGMRRSPGEIQQSLIELLKSEADLQLALADYAGLLNELEWQLKLLEAKEDLRAELVNIANWKKGRVIALNSVIFASKIIASRLKAGAKAAKEFADAAAEAPPKSAGTSSDVTSVLRSVFMVGGTVAAEVCQIGQFAAEQTVEASGHAKEIAQLYTESDIAAANYKYEMQQQLKEFQGTLYNEAPLRLAVFKAAEDMRQVSEKYRAVLGKGLRLMEERKAFNAKVAAQTQGSRYMDMNFRIGLNDALSKYRSSFDVAARFAYLAGKAYDYETNLSDNDPGSAGPLLAELMRQRTLGQYQDGRYNVSQGGLGGTLAMLKANFDALKPRMGLSSPQAETSRMSLRNELFRIRKDASEDDIWRKELLGHTTDNLWKVPEFRMFCRPFADESAGAQPGIVIPFTTNVISGRNFFGWPVGGGDHAYDPTNYATKVRSVGLWFEGYDNSKLSETPRAYLIPAGMDVMLIPDSAELEAREWTIVDQVIPVPLPVAGSDLADADWFPSLDSLSGPMTKIRKFSMARAYHDSGYFDESEMNYDTRLVGRSIWNTRWLLIIPGASFSYNQDYGMNTFINTVTDIKLFFETYAISGS